MAIPWSDEEMLAAVEAFASSGEELELEDDKLSAQYDDWVQANEEDDESLPSALAVEARFGRIINACIFSEAFVFPPTGEDEQKMEAVAQLLAQEPAELSDASRHAIIANGLAHYIWRNGPIEAVHGGGGLEALSGGDMMRMNALVSHIVSSNLTAPENLRDDLLKIRRELLDPRREWPTGETLWETCEGFIGELVKSINDSVAGVAFLATRTSPEHVYNFALFRGLRGEPSYWAGTPWWPFTVRVFIREAQEKKPWEDAPLVERWDLTEPLEVIERRLLEPLYLLDDDTAEWCAGSFSFCGGTGMEEWRAAGAPQL